MNDESSVLTPAPHSAGYMNSMSLIISGLRSSYIFQCIKNMVPFSCLFFNICLIPGFESDKWLNGGRVTVYAP